MSEMRAVYVEWEDASAVDDDMGWIDRETAKPAQRRVFKQLGFVFSVDAECLVLTEAYDHTNIAPRARIPAGMIRRLIELDDFLAAATAPKKRKR